MIDMAVIPARAGSVGLPGKNIRCLGGVPLIEWTLRAAIVSNSFRRVLVNTDCESIAEIALRCGAEVPFIRPSKLATSTAKLSDVLAHTFDKVGVPDQFSLLQPTSPFRDANCIARAVHRFVSTSAPSVIGVVQSKPIEWHYNLNADSRLVPISPVQNELCNRQDAETAYTPNGAIYLCRYKDFEEAKSLYQKETLGFEMSKIDSIDIDEIDDFDVADSLVAKGIRKIDSLG